MNKRLLIACAFLLAAQTARATNGYFSHGYSVAQKAMGGAGTALPEDSMIAAINPAGVVWVGDETSVGMSLFIPQRRYDASARGPGAQNGILTLDTGGLRSHNEYYPIPGISLSRPLNETMAWGFAMYANGGLNTEYTNDFGATFGQGFTGLETTCDGVLGGGVTTADSDNAGFCGNGRNRTSVDLAVMFLAPSFSMKVGDRSSIGVEPLVVISAFSAQGLGAFRGFSNQPDKVTDNGHETTYGLGYRVGFLTALIPYLNVGGSYQPKVRMGKFERYEGLFADRGNFDIPETWNLGLVLRLSEAQRLAFDYQRINYGDVVSVGNPLNPNDFVNNCALPRLLFGQTGGLQGSDGPSDACLGSATGPGFGWQDMTVYKFGYQFALDGFKMRLGYSKTRQPIPSTEVLFDLLAPGVVEDHFTMGISSRWSENLYISGSFMYAPENPVTGKNPLSNTSATFTDLVTGADTSQAFGPDANDQDIRIDMKQYELTIGLTWRY